MSLLGSAQQKKQQPLANKQALSFEHPTGISHLHLGQSGYHSSHWQQTLTGTALAIINATYRWGRAYRILSMSFALNGLRIMLRPHKSAIHKLLLWQQEVMGLILVPLKNQLGIFWTREQTNFKICPEIFLYFHNLKIYAYKRLPNDMSKQVWNQQSSNSLSWALTTTWWELVLQ